LRGTIKKFPQIYDPRKLLAPATDALQKAAEGKLKLMYTSGKAALGSKKGKLILKNN